MLPDDSTFLALLFGPIYGMLGWICLTMWNCPHGCGRKMSVFGITVTRQKKD